MRVRIVTVSHGLKGPAAEWFDEYAKRLTRYRVTLSHEVLSPKTDRLAPESAREEEGRLLAGRILSRGQRSASVRVVVLDERGKTFSSVELSSWIDKAKVGGVSEFVFVVGGAYGLSETVRAEADLVLAFGKMTMPHALVTVVLAEQIYRAATLSAGEPYHK